MRRPLAIHLAVCPGQALELPLVEPQLFGGTIIGLGVECAIMRDEALEAPGVAKNPVHHVSAKTPAQCAFPIFVNKRIVLLSVVEALHQVFVGSPAPVAVDRVDELLSVAG